MKVSIGRAARELGVSIPTLRRWEKAGKIPPAERTLGGHRRYDLNTLKLKLGELLPAPEEKEEEGG